jgi:hypothetical protein
MAGGTAAAVEFGVQLGGGSQGGGAGSCSVSRLAWLWDHQVCVYVCVRENIECAARIYTSDHYP